MAGYIIRKAVNSFWLDNLGKSFTSKEIAMLVHERLKGDGIERKERSIIPSDYRLDTICVNAEVEMFFHVENGKYKCITSSNYTGVVSWHSYFTNTIYPVAKWTDGILTVDPSDLESRLSSEKNAKKIISLLQDRAKKGASSGQNVL